METIYFYSVNDEYSELSNFAYYEISIDGLRWPTVEHYFQAQKFANKAYQRKIKTADNPMLAAMLGRDRKQKLRKDWESVKVSVMKQALMAKFTQHADLKSLLLSTGDAKLVEHTDNDSYWGDGGNGKGRNMLGWLLMDIREESRKTKCSN
ncbi:MAG: NADAR family protein [Prevotella sp.]|jgi:ribA/ribD-fused uncharacterized protein|nr:NADAR family protein [Prevotella sp.]